MSKITLTGTQTVHKFALRYNEYTQQNDVVNIGSDEKPLKMVITDNSVSAVYLDHNFDGTFTKIPLKVKFLPIETPYIHSGVDNSGGMYIRYYWIGDTLFWDNRSNKEVLEAVDIQTWDNITGFITFEHKCRNYPGSRDFHRDIKTIQFTLDEESQNILKGLLVC